MKTKGAAARRRYLKRKVMAKEKFKSLAKVPKALRDEIFQGMQLGESFGHLINRLESEGHKGFERRDLEHFGRWGDKALLLVLSLFLLLLFTAPARAEWKYIDGLNNGNATVGGTTTNNVAANSTNYFIAAGQSMYQARIGTAQTIALQPNFKMFSSGATSNVCFLVDLSVDGITWKTNAHTIAFPGSGTTQVYEFTNVAAQAYEWFRIGGIRNTNTVAATNIGVAFSVKPGI